MHIAYICVDPGVPIFGSKGASVHVQEIVRAFRARGDSVTIYCTRRGREVPDDLADLDVVEVTVARGGTAQREHSVRAAATTLAERAIATGCDLVYERFALFSDAASQVARALGVDAIVEVNAPLIEEQQHHRALSDLAGAQECAQRLLSDAAVVACVSEPVAAWARDVGAVRTLVAPNGVNTSRIVPSEGDHREGVVRVGFVGTLKPWHGVEVLIDAIAVVDAGVPAKLVLVGDGPEAQRLRERAESHLLDVDFVGAVAPEAMPDVLRSLDLGVAPYPADAEAYFSPLKVYEYLAAGLPVVASRVGQLPEAVLDGVTGLLVPPGDSGALAAAIGSLIDAPLARQRMAAAARADAVERHDWSGVLQRILDARAAVGTRS